MNVLGTLAATHPVRFVLGLTLTGFGFVLFMTGIAKSKLRKLYGEVRPDTLTTGDSCGLAYRWACSV